MYVRLLFLHFYLITWFELFSTLTQAAKPLIPYESQIEMYLQLLIIFKTLSYIYFIGLFEYNQST